MVKILRKVISLVALVFSDPDYKYPESKENTKTTEGEKSDTFQRTSPRKCYYCDGTGSVQDICTLERRMPSRYGGFSGSGFNDAGFSTCPICRGTGYVIKGKNK